MAHATMMAASALASGQLGSHLSRPHATNDSRLLLNLIKSERTYISHLHASVTSAHAAASALSAWGTSEAIDVTETSSKLASLLAACSDVQNTHVQAIEGYRAALKDVADREASIRNVVRDRDILVGRLIKTSNKSANLSGKSKKSPEERAEKVAMAQRELQSCEDVLAQEELALVGVKRRTFKEALTMRMKTMGDAGAAMVEAAQEAILLLDAFDSSAYQGAPSPIFNKYASNSVDQGWDTYQQQQQQHYDQQQYEQPQYDQSQQYDQHQQYDQQQHYDAHPHQQYDQRDVDGHVVARNVPLNNQFEISSVTPSQSASQIYQPQYQTMHSNTYAAPYHVPSDNGRQSQHRQQPLQNQNQMRQQEAESDSDEEDWRRSFNPAQNTVVHTGGNGTQLPAPHQLSANAGTHRTFMPYAAAIETTPGPTPPAKDTNKQLGSPVNGNKPVKKKKKKKKQPSLQQERNELFGPPNTVAMPPIPTAPRLNPDGVHVGDIPTAPKLYMPGASGDQDNSSSDEDVAIPVQSSLRQGWSNRQAAEEASSDGGRTAKQSARPDGVKRSNSFFGKMGRLFKSDGKGDGELKSKKEGRSRRDSINSSSTWNTRTDALVKESRKYASKESPSNQSRKQGALSRPIAREEANSSDEEPIDERNLIRVKNPKRPMWQAPKASSDIGTKSTLTDELKRLEAVKRTSSASVTAGPASYKASQEGNAAALSRSNTTTTTTIKKKKKKSTTEGTGKRAASLDGDSHRTSTGAARTSIIVSGDASSGIRRNDSLDYGSNDTVKKKKRSKRVSTASTPSMYGETKTGTINAMEGQGKFTTNNWVAKPGSIKEDPISPPAPKIYVPTAPAPSNLASTTSAPNIFVPRAPTPIQAPVQPITAATSTPTKLRTSQTAASLEEAPAAVASAPKHVPQPSATMSPPIKPALKLPGSTELTRSGSVASSMANIPSLPPPMSAPPPVTSMTLPSDSDFVSKQSSSTQPNSQSIQDHKGVAEVKATTANDSVPQSTFQSSAIAMPQIDEPTTEPFKGDLNIKGAEKGQGDESSLKTTEANQSSGVGRFTDRIASVGRGVLGWRGTSPSKNSTEEGLAVPPGKLSRSYSDQEIAMSSESSEDEDLPAQKGLPGMSHASSSPIADAPSNAMAASTYQAGFAAPALTNTIPTLAPITTTSLYPPAPASSVDGGSNVGRRKSVRMAPDVKLPPETPTDLVGSKEAGFNFQSPHSQLSSRIAPPPQAPPRINLQQDRVIDIGSNKREVQGWSVRATPMDDSSDEDDIDEYNQARKAFGSVSKGWSKSSKSSTSKPKKSSAPAETASLGGGPKLKKKKKRESSSNLGYNPSVPLPPGIEVVGSSRRSIR